MEALDRTTLRNLADATGGGAWLENLLKRYVEVTSADLRALRERLCERDHAEAAEIAHRTKSSCRTVGALELGDLLEAIEAEARAARGEVATALLQRADEVFSRVRDATRDHGVGGSPP